MKLPFEPTPQIKRFLEEILYAQDNFFDSPLILSVESFFPTEDITDLAIITNDSFWEYLEKIKAIKCLETDSTFLEFSSINRKTKTLLPSRRKIKILDAKKIRALYFDLFEKDKKITLAGRKIKFIEKESAVYIDSRKIEIPYAGHEYIFLRFIFGQGTNTPIDWLEISDEIYGEEESFGDEKKMRGVYDTMRAINRRICENAPTEDQLFSRKDNAITRKF